MGFRIEAHTVCYSLALFVYQFQQHLKYPQINMRTRLALWLAIVLLISHQAITTHEQLPTDGFGRFALVVSTRMTAYRVTIIPSHSTEITTRCLMELGVMQPSEF